MTHLDLFTGIGGFHLAASWAGFETNGFSEIEPYCCKLLVQHWPGIKNYGDIRTADFSELRGRITVISAGVPCQPASLAGKRRGEKDDRWLWPATLDVVGSVQPAWCIFENPDGILSLGEFSGVLSRLGTLGYSLRAFRVPASALGAGHQRYRVFTVAHNDSTERWTSKPGGHITDGKETGRQQGANGSSARNQVGIVSNSECNGSERGRNETRQASARTSREIEGRSFIADAKNGRIRRGESPLGETQTEEQGQRNKRKWSGNTASNSGKANSHSFRSGLEEWQSFEEYCRAQFPATQQTGDKQHCLRGFWYAQPPLCRGIPRIPNRSHRLKSLGNSVCPQQAYPFFAAIAETDAG
jgi:DNA (cytosine-5)-methyltransferase 1